MSRVLDEKEGNDLADYSISENITKVDIYFNWSNFISVAIHFLRGV